jgi:hypothetical protein
MSGLSLAQPDDIITDDVWKKLSAHYRQHTIELLVNLAIKCIARDVVDDYEKEILCPTTKLPLKIK